MLSSAMRPSLAHRFRHFSTQPAAILPNDLDDDVADMVIREYRVSDSVRNSLRTDLVRLDSPLSGTPREVDGFVGASKDAIWHHLPANALQILASIHNWQSPTVAVLFKNLPRDPLVPPSDADGNIVKPRFVMEALLAGLGELSSPTSKLIGYTEEFTYSHPLWHVGTPKAATSNSIGSAITIPSALPFHRDMARMMDHGAPHVLALGALREGYDTAVETTLVDNRDVVARLDEPTKSVLRQSRFRIATPQWADRSPEASLTRMPLLVGKASVAIQVGPQDAVVPLDQEAQRALEDLRQAIDQSPIHGVHLQTGDVLLFHNLRVLHGRSAYRDIRHNGLDRALMRSYFGPRPEGTSRIV